MSAEIGRETTTYSQLATKMCPPLLRLKRHLIGRILSREPCPTPPGVSLDKNRMRMRAEVSKKCNMVTGGDVLQAVAHSRPQRPRSFWSAPKITTSGQVQHRKSAIHGLPVTLRMLRVKSDKCDWFWSQSIVFTKPFKTGMSLDRARGRDFWC